MKLILISFAAILLICVGVSANHHSFKKFEQGKKIARHNIKAAHAYTKADFSNKAAVARQLMHDSKYIALGTQNSRKGFKGYPAANVQLVADGPADNGTGIPYTYMSKTDASVYDLEKNEKAAIFLSQGVIDTSCNSLALENKDVLCPRAELLGEMKKIKNDTDEYQFAWNALVTKFPALGDLDKSQYDVGKMFVKGVLVRGDDGRAEELKVKDYFNPKNAPKAIY